MTATQTQQTATLTQPDWLASKPDWAQAAIFAERDEDETDTQTDYFATRTAARVFLGWSRHTKDLFSELRKAAAFFSETAHLGPGLDVYTVSVVFTNDVRGNGCMHWTGATSPWHTELVERGGKAFRTRAEADAFVATSPAPYEISVDGTIATFAWEISKTSVEHREKYSMGRGYYLKASGRYSSGWMVRKTAFFGSIHDVITLAPALGRVQ
jgi:hypothetical protein